MPSSYTIPRTHTAPELAGLWDGPVWRQAEPLTLTHVRPESSDHHPATQARLLYDSRNIYVIFRVEDRYVRSVRTAYGDMVCKDSCVEFFVKPKADRGYLNFECNAGGTLLASYITDHTRTPEGFKQFVRLPADEGRQVRVYHSLPAVVEPERVEPLTWALEFALPLNLLAKYVGALGDPAGQTWSANLYKCGDETSHPHWISWSPVSALNFHLPDCFGSLHFAP
jgi:hypothetical protein